MTLFKGKELKTVLISTSENSWAKGPGLAQLVMGWEEGERGLHPGREKSGTVDSWALQGQTYGQHWPLTSPNVWHGWVPYGRKGGKQFPSALATKVSLKLFVCSGECLFVQENLSKEISSFSYSIHWKTMIKSQLTHSNTIKTNSITKSVKQFGTEPG